LINQMDHFSVQRRLKAVCHMSAEPTVGSISSWFQATAQAASITEESKSFVPK